MTSLRRAVPLLLLLAVLAPLAGAQSVPREADERGRARTLPAPAPPPAAWPPVTTGDPPGECERLRQRYLDSLACFGRFRNATGGIRAEAYAACGPEVPDPGVQCGPMRDPSGLPR